MVPAVRYRKRRRVVAMFGLFSLVFAVASVACYGGPATRPGPKQERVARNDPQPEHPVRTIRVAEMQFADPALKKKFLLFDATVRRFAKPGWHTRPYKTFGSHSARGAYFAEWATFANKDGRNPINYHGSREVHCLSMLAFFDADSPKPGAEKQIVGFRVDARWKPAGGGWGAAVWYKTFHGADYPRSKRPEEDFQFLASYRPMPGMRGGLPLLTFNRAGLQVWSDSVALGGEGGKATRYRFAVWNRPRRLYDDKKRVIPDKDVMAVLASSEALRDFVLKSLDDLEKRLKTEIPSGKAVVSAQYDRRPEFGEDPRRLISKRKLTDEEKKQLLRKALAEVALRKTTIREHHREIHAAVLRAFPITKSLKSIGKTAR